MVQSSTDAPEESDLWTAWQLFPLDDDQTCHSKDIEWAIELLYNTVKTGSQLVFGDPLLTRCGRESPHPAEWASGWAALENKKDTMLMAIRMRVNMLQFCLVSNSLSHATFQIKWEVYFLKKSSLVFIHCVNMYSACICVYMHIYYVAIQQSFNKRKIYFKFKTLKYRQWNGQLEKLIIFLWKWLILGV